MGTYMRTYIEIFLSVLGAYTIVKHAHHSKIAKEKALAEEC